MALLVYAFVGSSRAIAIRPVDVASLLLESMLTNEIADFETHDYVQLAFTVTFFIGITQMALVLFRYLCWISRFKMLYLL